MGEIPIILLDSFTRAPWGWALLVSVIITLIKVWPVLSRQASEARDRLRQEKRSDLQSCHERLDKLSDEFHHLELKLLGAISAYKILDLEVETHLPGSTALGQARVIMSTAFTLSPSTPETGTPQ